MLAGHGCDEKLIGHSACVGTEKDEPVALNDDSDSLPEFLVDELAGEAVLGSCIFVDLLPNKRWLLVKPEQLGMGVRETRTGFAPFVKKSVHVRKAELVGCRGALLPGSRHSFDLA